ncbi:DNA/RNA helicase domain-containing protein [Paraliobacillus sp. X-1268]|uniref:DNA/RNA helicase domain-containing protein n=1 Tax=Paraliobacillus sp. X-1268 TaxID=2213193 RepID=UPI000E3DC005|nr:DNA/RNA helicase domain-containing protein [Paraliobacillus sp. X-1268]
MLEQPVSLISITNSNKDLTDSTKNAYFEKLGVSISSSELDDLYNFVKNLKKHKIHTNLFNDFYIGFKINQIGKEFDLLRFGKSNIINIELKKEHTGEKIVKQLIMNKYYLKFLKKDVFNFTYVASEETLYYLESNNTIVEVEFKFLIDKLIEQDIIKVNNINNLFDPANYLVSPFNSTDRFVENEYFLTNHQDKIKKELIHTSQSSKNKFFSIEGAAGTGKTLLVYDLAKEYMNNRKNVVIIHVGNLNMGHDKLNNQYNWNIIPVKNFKTSNYENFDLIILDEVQRINPYQLDIITEHADKHNITCLFSHDPIQCLHTSEIKNDIPGQIDKIVNKNFKLSKKIRTNPEISNFILNLFDLSKKREIKNFQNIDIQYFSTIDESEQFIDSLLTENWTTINYTPQRWGTSSLTNLNVTSRDTAHTVVGQEYDKIVAIIGNTFTYDNSGKIIGDRNSYYHPTRMLFQILTRARKKICLVVIGNELMLNKCLEILESKRITNN